MSLKSFKCAVLPVKKLCHWAISFSLRRHRKGKNSMVLTSSCYKSICSQALPVQKVVDKLVQLLNTVETVDVVYSKGRHILPLVAPTLGEHTRLHGLT
uniref:Uncharacterized protein n=1 Tax=Oryza rufipogon TaxID=4529 RepID=A0A0E0R6M8_ORYRU